MDEGITTSDVEKALESVSTSAADSSYDQYLIAPESWTMFGLRYLNGLPIETRIAPEAYEEFRRVLQAAWSQHLQGNVSTMPES